jgi:RNA polymerase sigma-70 factor (ECF subfamily)
MQALISSDEKLVENVLEGDETAFCKLYERYRHLIYSTAHRLLKNSEDAWDVTQEVTFKLYKSLHQWDVQKAKLSTWIYKMAVNHSIDYHRARCRRKESQFPEDISDPDSRFDVPDCSSRSAFKEIENKERLNAVLQCAWRLPAQQRRIFFDRYFDECKLEEIAEIERCSLGTVKSSLYRTTHSLRDFLCNLSNLSVQKDPSGAVSGMRTIQPLRFVAP